MEEDPQWGAGSLGGDQVVVDPQWVEGWSCDLEVVAFLAIECGQCWRKRERKRSVMMAEGEWVDSGEGVRGKGWS